MQVLEHIISLAKSQKDELDVSTTFFLKQTAASVLNE